MPPEPPEYESDLVYVPTEDLVTELFSRFCYGVIMIDEPLSRSPGSPSTSLKTKGDPYRILGLLRTAMLYTESKALYGWTQSARHDEMGPTNPNPNPNPDEEE